VDSITCLKPAAPHEARSVKKRWRILSVRERSERRGEHPTCVVRALDRTSPDLWRTRDPAGNISAGMSPGLG
jgi:hypothetical protein